MPRSPGVRWRAAGVELSEFAHPIARSRSGVPEGSARCGRRGGRRVVGSVCIEPKGAPSNPRRRHVVDNLPDENESPDIVAAYL
jgi:hypothetical protein